MTNDPAVPDVVEPVTPASSAPVEVVSEGPWRGRGAGAAGPGERFGLLVIFAVVVMVFGLLNPATFLTLANAQNIVASQSVLAVVGLALMMPLVGGRFDVSVGGILAVCAVVCAMLMSSLHLPLPLAVVAAIALGTAVGLVNGAIVAFLGVNSIIATIGTGTVLGGLVQALTGGIPISTGLSPALTELSTVAIAGVPAVFVVAVVLAVAVWFVLTQTPFGRRLVATGSNPAAAHLVGVKTRRVVLTSFLCSGGLAGVAGVLQVAVQGSGDPGTGGLPFILPALAAVFLGATTWRPGTYNVPGMLIGLLFVGAMISGFVLLGVQPWVTDVLNGAVVVAAIIVSAQIRRRRTGALAIGS
jgi:ribose transport system permease protein